MEQIGRDEFFPLDQPKDPALVALHALWLDKHRGRPMPARADFHPSEFRALLPYFTLFDVVPPPDVYRVRLMGQALVDFYGQNRTGLSPRDYLDADTAERFIALARFVIEQKAPFFRTGRMYWVAGKEFKRFESMYMPLSDDGATVNMIMGVLKLLD